MDISKIISISGMPGLYKVIGQSKNGVIVESLTDKKRFPAFGSSPISKLEDISVFTTAEDMPLKEVYKRIFEKEKGGKTIDPRTSDEKAMRAYMESVVPEYDAERVHASDLKKMFNWYNLLQASGLLEAEEQESDEKVGLEGDKDRPKVSQVKKDVAPKQVKTNAPRIKPQGVRKTGSA